jgi:hypothetical protein
MKLKPMKLVVDGKNESAQVIAILTKPIVPDVAAVKAFALAKLGLTQTAATALLG